VILTPEEWVRQNFLKYLVEEKKYPASLIAVEKEFKLNNLSKRSDAVIYNKQGNPYLIIECKAPEVKIDQKVFDQIARYNMVLNVELLVVTNGLQHFCCKLDAENDTYYFLKEIPDYSS